MKFFDDMTCVVFLGGVRCERASAYVKYLGVKEVYQLHGEFTTINAIFLMVVILINAQSLTR